MTFELEKVDLVRERLGVTYREAVGLLQKARGDVVEALALGEENLGEEEESAFLDQLREQGNKVLQVLRNSWNRTSRTRLRIKKNDQVVVSVPSTAGAVAVLAMAASTPLAVLGGIGLVGGMLNNYSLELERQKITPADLTNYPEGQ